jgi:hypothetical protein
MTKVFGKNNSSGKNGSCIATSSRFITAGFYKSFLVKRLKHYQYKNAV